jgi:hypothetical protein
MVVNAWYYEERILYAILGSLAVVIGIAQIQSQKFEPEVRDLHKLLHVSEVIVGLTIVVWSVDTQGAFGIYNYWVLPIIKDIIKSIVLLCVLYFLAALVSVLSVAYIVQVRKLIFKIVFIPFALICVLMLVTDLVAASLNQVIVRTPAFIVIGLLCTVGVAFSLWTLWTIRQAQKNAAEGKRNKVSTETSSAQKKLLWLSIVFLVQGGVAFNDAYIHVVTNGPGSLEKQQIPSDPSQARAYLPFWLYYLAVIAIIGVGWIPMRFSQAKTDNQVVTVSQHLSAVDVQKAPTNISHQ